jgi:hypothetical protein
MTLISQLSFLVSIMVVDKWGESDFIGLSLLFLGPDCALLSF